MVVNGHYGDGDGGVVMLASIVVGLRKGEAGTGAWLGFRGYPLPPSVRT
jgi:hypothetical protein